MRELLNPMNDFVFKRIFAQKKNEDLLKSLIESILPEIEIQGLEVVREVELEREIATEKIRKNGFTSNHKQRYKSKYRSAN